MTPDRRGEALEAFFDELLVGVQKELGVCYADFIDAAVMHGLLTWVPYDPAVHGDWGAEPGEMIWVVPGRDA